MAQVILIVGLTLLKNKVNEEQLIIVRNMVSSKDKYLREYSCYVLGELKDIRAKDYLLKALDDNEVDVRSSAFYAFAQIGSPELIEQLKKYLETDDIETYDSAFNAIWEIAKQNKMVIS